MPTFRNRIAVVLAGTGLLMGLTRVAAADEVDKATQQALQAIITQQIEAFERDDGDAAFAFASPHIQEQFGNSGRFLDMVRRAYPAVHRPRSVDFAELLVGDGTIVQQVELVGPDGQPQTALYEMERGADGAWRIAGCSLVRSPRVGA